VIGWRRARAEAAGAYRSVRYDLTKRSGPRHDTTDVLYPEYDAYEPDDRSRRAATAAGLGLVLAAAAVGVYFAVAGGMGVLLAYGSPGSPADRPAASAGPSGDRTPRPSSPAASGPSGSPSASVSPSPSRRPTVRATPTRRQPTRPAPTTAPAPPPVTTAPPTNFPSPTPSPPVTNTNSLSTNETPVEQP
jgi:hypothetical protein